MKKYYLYVPDGDEMTIDSVVVWLSVGSSAAECKKLTLLECYAEDCGQFLRVRDEDTDFWLSQRAKELFPDSNCPRLHLVSATLPIGVAYKKVIDGDLDMYVRNEAKRSQYLQTLLQLDADFMQNHAKKSCMTSCPRGKRQNLSLSRGSVLFLATLPITLMVFGGLVDRLGELIINFLF